MLIADEIKRLTSDPGARKAGEYLDQAFTRLATLEKTVAACCGGGGSVAPTPSPAPAPAPAPADTPPTT